MNNKGFLTIIGLLLVLVIICVLFYTVLNSYFNQSSLNNDETKAALKDEKEANFYTDQDKSSGSTGQISVLQSATKQIKKIEQMQIDRAKNITTQYQGTNY